MNNYISEKELDYLDQINTDEFKKTQDEIKRRVFILERNNYSTRRFSSDEITKEIKKIVEEEVK